LSEKDVLNANKIKCKECNGEFRVKENEFKSNEVLTQLIESQSHLSEEEISLKQELEESIQKFFQFYDEFIQNKTNLDMDVFNHFQEMRFQIDEHREELKKKIDDIALEMIDQTKKNEALYLKNLKESFSSFDDCKSLDTQCNEIEETFRNPNMLIQTIKEMQKKQEESLKDIKFKLTEMNQVKYHVKATNQFEPNPSLLNQEGDPSLFGLIKLNGYLLNFNPFKSEIISYQQSLELLNLCGFSLKDKWSLLYRATRDGFEPCDFHSKCDCQSNTLTIFKAKESKFIFGGFTTAFWDSSSGWKSDPSAFIFSLTNKNNKPLKMKIDPNRHKFAICCNSKNGPSFGLDIHISNNTNTTMNSFTSLGHTYTHPLYANRTNEAELFLAGSHYFLLDEIEVYQKE